MNDDEWIDDGVEDEPVYPYDAFDKRDYRKVLSEEPDRIVYPGYSDSYFQASKYLMKGIVEGELDARAYGTATTFLFRHYIELSVKELVLSARSIKSDGTNAEEIKKIKWEHFLKKLWNEFCDAAPHRIGEKFWRQIDKEYITGLIEEFDDKDRKSMAFRYDDQQKYNTDFRELYENLDHIHDVLNKLSAYLVDRYLKNLDGNWNLALSYLDVPDFD
jgi:hypothetical protein